MGPVEQAFRARLQAPHTYRTISRRVPFALRSMGHDGIVIELGDRRTPTSVSWECLESVPPFMRAHRGWVKSGGVHNADAEPGTLHAHLLGWVPRDIANWVVALLLEAGLVDVDKGPPLLLRLRL